MKALIPSFFLLVFFIQLSFGQNYFPASGNVGIGIGSPTQLLDVVGSNSAYTSSAKTNAYFVQDHTNYRGVFLGFDNSGQIGTIGGGTSGAPSNLAFWNYSGAGWFEGMRLTSAGYLGIGTASPFRYT